MRVAGNQYTKKKDNQAVQTVRKINKKQPTPHLNTNYSAAKITYYKYTNEFTGEEINLTRNQLMALARDFIKFCQESQDNILLQTFWTLKGIPFAKVKYWCENIPAFDAIYSIGRQLIGDKREVRLAGDMTHLRNRQSVYVQEYHDYDVEMYKFKESFRANLESTGFLNQEQIEAVILKCFPPTPKPENWNVRRENAGEREANSSGDESKSGEDI